MQLYLSSTNSLLSANKGLRWLFIVIGILALTIVSETLEALNTQEQRWVDAVTKTYGSKAGRRVEAWREALDKYKSLPTELKLQRVNQFMNQMRWVSDEKLWGKNDYWATPLEFLGAGAGDCEDFTISKYFSLLEIGIPDSKLRLIYVKAITYNQFHMVLAYYESPSSEPLILDNINPDIERAGRRKDLLPIYSFNGQNLWLMKSKNGQLAGDSSRLSLWNDLRDRERSLILNKPIVSYD
ncbi:transglutaminase-like cysteine peptidase [Vibrio viridaestus]|uniref:Sulfate adenylyltransferase n=1 Tax=Vibrio viridaestus TaxID=2487322 RepID=A0A3N9U5Q3_9VIBR|nr:transglutaminase-like cysteine peptidase [Vibrio viridaestus]RQW65042.1 sulfate adenylyltransferase [Vibrio viridaestus]